MGEVAECAECKRQFDPTKIYRQASLVKGTKGENVYLCPDCRVKDALTGGKYAQFYEEWWREFNPFSNEDRKKWPHPTCPATVQLFSDSRHVRKDFLLKGEGWGCFLENSPSYDTLSGSTSHRCERRGEFHFRMPWNAQWGLRGSSSMGTNCAIVCAKHSRIYLNTPELTTLTLFGK